VNVRKLLIALAAAAAFAFWFTHRGLDQAKVEAFYASQVDAFAHDDRARLCAQYAADYKGVERQVSRTGVQDVRSDKDQACKSVDFLFDFKKRFDAKQTDGGVLATEFEASPSDIVIARDGKSADVHLRVHVNFGGAFIGDSEGSDHLVLRGGKLLSAGSEMNSHVSGPLVDGLDPASLMTPSGH
jgi:hypothetical protein